MSAAALDLLFHSVIGRHRHRLWLPRLPDPFPALPRADAGLRIRLPLEVFPRDLASLGLGRFYPSRLLNRPGPSPAPVFRVTALTETAFEADFNPPLAYGAHARLEPGPVLPLPALERPAETLFDWAGMEAPLAAAPTDFAEPDAFRREDESPDARFYARPRRVPHVDGHCAARLTTLHGEWLPADGDILDLMAGWTTYVPAGHARVTGLGLNEAELMENERLQAYVVHDLNRDPALPFADASFDAVINSLSIEYLVQPLAVLQEVLRVLRPGGRLVVSFSHRWFPPKAIRLWTRLHPMERLGWVLQLCRAAGFTGLETRVERGLGRDPGDRHRELAGMDPLFAVLGRRPA